MHDAFHIVFLVIFFCAAGVAFLGLIRPMLDGEGGLRLPGPKVTAGLMLAGILAAAADWILHRYIL